MAPLVALGRRTRPAVQSKHQSYCLRFLLIFAGLIVGTRLSSPPVESRVKNAFQRLVRLPENII